MNRFLLSRRTVLKAAGVTLALPSLEAMGQAAAAPLRMLFFFAPNGVHLPNYVPTTTGAGYSMPPSLQPLAPYQASINVLSGLNATVTGALGDAHGKGVGSFLTGLPLNSIGASGASVDQLADQALGGSTALRSLVVSAASSGAGSFDADGVDSNMVYSNISYSAQNTPVPPLRTPTNLFRTVFGTPSPPPPAGAPDNTALYQKSVLDAVQARITKLNARLGASDKQRLDAHLTAVREVEQRVVASTTSDAGTSIPAPMCATPAAPTNPTGFVDRTNLLLDIMALAVACDRTRFMTFMLANAAGDEEASDGTIAGQPSGHHAAAHAADYATVSGFTSFYLTFAARLLQKLSVPEGNGTVLDNCLVLIGNELSSGTQHVSTNMPCVLAGRAGGKVVTGRHIAYGGTPRLTQLHVAMMQIIGMNVSSFADATAPLPGLTS
jgi:hypothetical protein